MNKTPLQICCFLMLLLAALSTSLVSFDGNKKILKISKLFNPTLEAY